MGATEDNSLIELENCQNALIYGRPTEGILSIEKSVDTRPSLGAPGDNFLNLMEELPESLNL